MSTNNMFTVVYKTVDGRDITTDVYVLDAKHQNTDSNGTAPRQVPVMYSIHGGAFMLGHSRMVSKVQTADALSRGWLVVAPDHRLCPQVNILTGPISDIRSLHAWVHAGHLDAALASHGHSGIRVDKSKIVSMGTSSGGTLAHSLTFDTSAPAPAAIYDFYGAKNFRDPFWNKTLDFIPVPTPCTPGIERQIYDEKPIPIHGGVSLEGQADPSKPPPPDPRRTFAFDRIRNGTVISTCYPDGSTSSSPESYKPIDPVLNVTSSYPPTCIIHGLEDKMVPKDMSSDVMMDVLKKEGVKCLMVEVEGEGHTFAGAMVKGSKAWDGWIRGLDWIEGIIEGRQ